MGAVGGDVDDCGGVVMVVCVCVCVCGGGDGGGDGGGEDSVSNAKKEIGREHVQ